ncbi:MAG: Ku protein [Deltaproteobacteria bacterium]|nr:Ku protein [Deltaproteobacteria bacterium]
MGEKAADRQEPAGQAIWTGTIGFSLVAIPVRLVRAIEPGRVSFRLLHRTDYSPLLRRMVCPEEGKIVPPEEIIRGYEIGPEKYILVSDAELESLAPERSRTIEIVDFIDLAEVDPLYYDHPYYLLPAKGGEKAYRLLVEVMRRTKKAGLAKFVLGEREYLVAVKSAAGALCLMTLHYSEELLAAEGLAPADAGIDRAEKSRLQKIVREMSADFNPDRYADGRRERILALLEKKRKHQPLVEAPAVGDKEGAPVVDLVAALRERMAEAKRKGR